MEMRDWKNFFTAEDFRPKQTYMTIFSRVGQKEAEQIRDLVNAILREELDRARIVYLLAYAPEPFSEDISFLNRFALAKSAEGYLEPATHTARLVDIQEIK
jgi:hypothetical protein